ncbi:unnamed protein product, partial [Pylaiella littoralis]
KASTHLLLLGLPNQHAPGMLRSAKFASAIKSMATSLSPHNQQGCNAGTTSFLPACLKPPRQQHHQQA